MKRTLANTFPHLLKEWDYTRNGSLTPHDVPPKGRQVVWWVCKNEHSYRAKLANKANGKTCPECNIISRSITVQKPEVLKYWDYEKNTVSPDRVSYGSNKVYWWKCEYDHSFDTSAGAMTRKGRASCPYCRGLRVDESNSLATLFPEVANDWIVCIDDNTLSPETITPGSSKKVKWKCQRGHEWITTPKHRTSGNTGCPNCKKGRRISKQSYTLFYYLKQEFDDAILEYPLKGSRMSLDLFIPSQKIAIEYDGGLFHKKVKRDINKEKLLLEKMPDVSLIRIREPDCGKYTSPNPRVIKYHLANQKTETFERCLECLFLDVFRINKKINLEKDNADILTSMDISEVERSLGEVHPNLSKEWDIEKNNGLTPFQFRAASHEKVYWRCKHNHSWPATIASRSHGGNNCPYCGSRKVSPENNLATKYPTLLQEWHPTKNKKKPVDCFPYSHDSVWWLCLQCNHEWRAVIYNRTLGNSSCPNCI